MSAQAMLTELRDRELLTPDQLRAAARLAEAADPRALPAALVRAGLLTRWQVAELATGRGSELRVGQYVLLDRLGEGGMGQVYRARHVHMGRIVALKLMRKDKLTSADSVQRFAREMQAAAKLSHPNIVQAFDAGPTGAGHFLAMELV